MTSNSDPRAGGSDPDPEFRRDIIALIRRGEKIKAIQLLREATGLGLAEAKAEIDHLFTQAGKLEGLDLQPKATFVKRSGCLVLVVVSLAALAAAAVGFSR